MAKTTTGFSVRIFIPSGEPEGLRIVEKSNWTGQGLVFPRSLFAETRRRINERRTESIVDDAPPACLKSLGWFRWLYDRPGALAMI
jgi:hypothetical protein